MDAVTCLVRMLRLWLGLFPSHVDKDRLDTTAITANLPKVRAYG